MKISYFLKKSSSRVVLSSMIYALWMGMLLPLPSCNESFTQDHDSVTTFPWEEPLPLTQKDKDLALKVDTFFRHKVQKSRLNGCVLVASEGKVIYHQCFGYSDYYRKKNLTDSSAFQLASVSKPFTATAILILYERGKLSLDDHVSKYIAGFPYDSITIRSLLDHRSGLANYIYLFDTVKIPPDSFITNKEVVNYFISRKPPLQALPNHKFQYCNTNYALLAYIVEQVSGMSFSDFLNENIFLPAHMYHSYVRNIFSDSINRNQVSAFIGSRWEKVSNVADDGVVGDKGVFTTTWDLYLFDQALNHNILLNKETLEQAYTAYSHEKPGQKNYGLGWRMKDLPDSSKIIYHNGWWRGYNSLFVRKPEKGICIIILSNKYNRNVYDVKSLFALLNLEDGDMESGEE